LENIYVKSPFLAQIFVYGDSLKAKLVAIGVPDDQVVNEWKTKNGIELSIEELCHNAEFNELVKGSLSDAGDYADVRGFERIADFRLVPELFSVENDLLTPTFKLKRPQAKDRFIDLINEMYENVD